MSGLPFDEFVTVAEIAEVLKVNPQTVRNWIRDGRLPAFRLGRAVRVRRRDLDAMIATAITAAGRPDERPAA